jgi:acetate kinase
VEPGGRGGAARVLTVNAGSTSLKLHVVDGDESRPVESLADAQGVAAVGHRVVHGGARFVEPVLVDDAVEAAIEELRAIAPLHNEPALRGLREARDAFPGLPQVAAFDTAFHATIPPEASTYAVPRAWREQLGIRRFGFHGLNVEWVASQVQVPRLVVCHLGGGCSVTAVREGRSVDTTMGFTPLEGVPMKTRSGSVDPGALLHVLRHGGLDVDELDHALEHDSGTDALGGLDDGLAFAVFSYRIATAVAAMATATGGLDALAFTAGLGENRADVRDAVTARLAFLQPFDVHVVAAREELTIARAVRSLGYGS